MDRSDEIPPGGVLRCTLFNCTVTGNSGGGGACYSTLYNCILTDNPTSGAAQSTLYNCILTDNRDRGASGCTLYNCTLTGNSTGDSGGGALGCTLYNCTVTENLSIGRGGGVSGSTLFNCTVTRNYAEYGGGACGGTLYNCIVYYNTAPNGPNYYTGTNDWEVTVLRYSCTTPLPTDGVGNITGPPLFMDMAGGDFRLLEESPCIDAGTNLLGLQWTNVWGELCTYSGEPTDILGITRFIDGNGDGKVAWDIGAYEFNSFKPPRFDVYPQLTPDGWKLHVSGATNKWVQVQSSSNLKDWWNVLPAVYMGAEGVQQVIDPSTEPKVFYRAVVP
jgi:hypothetical protein